MSNEQNIDAMSTDQLADALQSDLNVLDGKSAPEPEAKPDAQPEPKPSEAKPADEKPADEAADPGKGDDGEGEGNEEGNPYRKRINRLLRKTDTLESVNAEKDRKIAEQQAEIERLKGNNDDDDQGDDLDSEGKPNIKDEINIALEERDRKKDAESKKQQAQESEFNALLKKVPNASQRKSEILEVAKDNPRLSFEAIDRMLAPEDHVDAVELNRKNAQRLNPGSNSRSDLETDEDITKASPDKQEKYLREQIASGKLVI